MFQTKLIFFLKTLDQKEMVRFGEFLASPFFFRERKIKEALDLFHYLKPHYPTFSDPALAKEKVFARLYPGEDFRERKFKHLMTKTNKALEQFIVVCYRDKAFGILPEELCFTTFFREKELPEHFQKTYQKAIDRQAENKVKDVNHYWIDFLLAKELAEQESIFNRRKSDLNLPQTLSRLDHFFLVTKLESACVFLNQTKHQIPLKAKGSLAALEALLPLLQQGHFREEPLINVLYQTYLLLQEEVTDLNYQELKAEYDQHWMNIGLSLRQIIHGALRNFCSQQLNEGREEYLEELFSLYQEGLLQGVLDSNGGLLPSAFQNMVTLGLKLEKYGWVEQFLEDFRHKIIGMNQPESIYMLNRANLLFAKAEYAPALDYLTFGFEDIYFKLIARRLEVQIYYECGSPLLEAKMQAFKIFVFRISKSRLTTLQQEGYSNFIGLLKQVVHPSTRFNPKRIKGLITKVKAKKTVAEKKWLLDKLENM